MANQMPRFDNCVDNPLINRSYQMRMVEPDGIEPTTSAVRLLRSPN
jgi:hypothetical protein